MNATTDLEYANQWEQSAKYFYDKNYYEILGEKLSKFHTLLEIGCGVGYSTLSLLKLGHKVIAIDKNEECIKKATSLIKQNGYSVGTLPNADVMFIKVDIISDNFYKVVLPTLVFDAVTCWNVGANWKTEDVAYYIPYMLDYGLNVNQIQKNFESSYVELLVWHSCQISKARNVPFQLVERSQEKIDNNDEYYQLLKQEFNFNKIEFNSIEATTISAGGRVLISKGKIFNDKIVKVYLTSIIMKYK